MATWFDLATSPPEDTWRKLRTRRSTPLSLPGKNARRDTFQGALEQAEQQFRAASLIGYDSRPLNLFYGLSQAGRAIAAAAPALDHSQWKLSGHGLSVAESLSSLNPAVDFPKLTVKHESGDSTSFGRLSQLLDSSTGPFTMGESWAHVHDHGLQIPFSSSIYQPMFVNLDKHRSLESPLHRVTLTLPPTLTSLPREQRPPLAEFLSQYPALDGWKMNIAFDSEPDWPPDGQNLELRFAASHEQVAGHEHAIQKRVHSFRSLQLVLPRVGADAKPLHPLMAWWTILFTLSMLARYEPAKWRALIDVDKSRFATAIEFVMDTAIAAVPELINETLDAVS